MQKQKTRSFRPGKHVMSFRPCLGLKKKVIKARLEVQKENEAADKRQTALHNERDVLHKVVR